MELAALSPRGHHTPAGHLYLDANSLSLCIYAELAFLTIPIILYLVIITPADTKPD